MDDDHPADIGRPRRHGDRITPPFVAAAYDRLWHQVAVRGSAISRQILRVEQTCHGRRGTAESDPLQTSAALRQWLTGCTVALMPR